MSAHTPGPWVLARHSHRGDALWLSVHQHDDPVGMKSCIAEIECSAISDDVLRANAQLIAAAPDLLSAITALTADYEAMCGDGLTEINQPDVLRTARAAIAKAGCRQ